MLRPPLPALCAALPLLAAAWLPVHAAEAALAYVSNQQGAVSVLDLDKLELRGNLEVGARGPRGLGLTDDGRWLVTANLQDQNISVIDTGSGALLRQVPIGKNPEFVRVLGQTAYVTYEPGSTGSGPPKAGAAESKDDDDKLPGHVAVVDLQEGRVVLDIVGKPETEGVEFSRDGRLLILTNESDNSLSVHDRASGKLLRSVAVGAHGDRPRGIKARPDGSGYVVTLELSDKLLVFDDRFEFVREVATAKAPYGVAFDPQGKRVFVAAAKARLLQVYDTATWQKIRDIPTGERCWHFSFTPDGRHVLLACGRSNEVVVVDAASLEVVKRIGNLQAPWGIVTYPRAAGSID
jgi:YVTN family beta-propeller protein